MNNDNQRYKIFHYEAGGVYFLTSFYSGRLKTLFQDKELSTAATFNLK